MNSHSNSHGGFHSNFHGESHGGIYLGKLYPHNALAYLF